MGKSGGGERGGEQGGLRQGRANNGIGAVLGGESWVRRLGVAAGARNRDGAWRRRAEAPTERAAAARGGARWYR
ncbi:hypothetical protein FE772_05535 [Lysobacter enzymogenes]|nr:hypothetical protein [Lysobacter enzymogenes]QCW25199.1 hypothetical protein FE772_05535 [Lysobacter enzymogenes]